MSKALTKQADRVRIDRPLHAVLKAIAWLANDDGWTKPRALHHLEERCRYAPRTIQRHLLTLISMGAVAVFPRPGRWSIYQIDLVWLLAEAGPEPTPKWQGCEGGPTPKWRAPSTYTKKENTLEEEETRAGARDPAPSEDEILVEVAGSKQASGIEEVVQVAPEPFPEEPVQLEPAEVAMIREAGWDPIELADEVREWCNGEAADTGKAPVSKDWPRVMVRFAIRTSPPRRRQVAHRPGQWSSKPEARRPRVALWAMEELRAQHAARQGAVA